MLDRRRITPFPRAILDKAATLEVAWSGIVAAAAVLALVYLHFS
jgi:hypothetical protein